MGGSITGIDRKAENLAKRISYLESRMGNALAETNELENKPDTVWHRIAIRIARFRVKLLRERLDALCVELAIREGL